MNVRNVLLALFEFLVGTGSHSRRMQRSVNLSALLREGRTGKPSIEH